MFSILPSVDRVLAMPAVAGLIRDHGRRAVTAAIRTRLGAIRQAIAGGADGQRLVAGLADQLAADLARAAQVGPQPVLNLTGVVLHTNLGRALLAEPAQAAAATAMARPVALEMDPDSGGRGERDEHLRQLVCELTGAEDATVVNNNAAAVLLVLNTFGRDREAIVSRGELIEIGGAFRLPEIMAGAGTRLVEVGTTNRTHAHDYRQALSPQTGLLLKVHTSNYRVEGFTASVPARELAGIAAEAGVPLLNDLGSGSLLDLSALGLRREPTVAQALAEGAGLVTFSGDKLLGGPQAGFIAGRRELVAAVNRNPLKRALRLDKIRIAALAATLQLYRDPDSLATHLPTLRHLARPRQEIAGQAGRLQAAVQARLGDRVRVETCECASQVGSGALPVDTLASAGLRLRPLDDRRGSAPERLAAQLRSLPVPVLGRIRDGALILDLRCLDRDADLLEALAPP